MASCSQKRLGLHRVLLIGFFLGWQAGVYQMLRTLDGANDDSANDANERGQERKSDGKKEQCFPPPTGVKSPRWRAGGGVSSTVSAVKHTERVE
jgi:hypothetical protein